MISTLMAVAATHLIDFESLINEIRHKKPAWEAGINQKFINMDWADIVKMMGTIPTPDHLKFPNRDIQPLKDLPTNFDPREQWPQCQSFRDVRDQSTCGSCWAFAAVQAMSDRICVASNGTKQTRISSQDLLSCCKTTCGSGCNGGYPQGAWSYFKNTGISTGFLYGDKNWCRAYTLPPCSHHVNSSLPNCTGDSPTPKCVQSCDAGTNKNYQLIKGKSVYSLGRVESQIMTDLMTHGSAEASFTVYEDFLTYKSGVYHHVSGRALGGHAVKLMGWGVQNGEKYWLVANSWNNLWGDKGYFKIRRGTNECGFESGIVAGLV